MTGLFYVNAGSIYKYWTGLGLWACYYRYTNGKAYSESDYGSEFGQNGVAGQSSRASGLPSEAGTQNYQQSTLGRRN